MAEQRSIRDMLMTYGYNEGKRLTDEELTDLLFQEIKSLPVSSQRQIAFRLQFISPPEPIDDQEPKGGFPQAPW